MSRWKEAKWCHSRFLRGQDVGTEHLQRNWMVWGHAKPCRRRTWVASFRARANRSLLIVVSKSFLHWFERNPRVTRWTRMRVYDWRVQETGSLGWIVGSIAWERVYLYFCWNASGISYLRILAWNDKGDMHRFVIGKMFLMLCKMALWGKPKLEFWNVWACGKWIMNQFHQMNFGWKKLPVVILRACQSIFEATRDILSVKNIFGVQLYTDWG